MKNKPACSEKEQAGFLVCKFQFSVLFEMRTAPLAPRACEGGGRAKRGRGEYIRTPPVKIA